MTAARNLASVVSQLATQGLDRPNVNPIVINGDLTVSNYSLNSLGTTFTGLGDSDEGYVIHDRLRHTIDAGAGRYTAADLAITDLPGFSKCLHLDCTTAEASLGTNLSLIHI